MGRWDPVSYQ